MHVLVTGGAGFIGHHVVQALAKLGHTVVSVDHLATPQKELVAARSAAIAPYAENHVIDVADTEALDRIFRTHTFDVVYHLAAKAGVRESITNPFIYAHSNYLGTLSVLECAKRHGVERVIFASSSSVYGKNTKTPFSEDDRVDGPISVYASTKRAGELLAYTYADLFGMTTTCLRFFTVYGPYGRPDMAPFIFTKKIIEGEPIEVFNNGDQMRDFTFVDDIVDGVLGAVNAPRGFSVFNLGNGSPVALGDFIAAVERSCGKEAKKIFREAQQGDVSQTHADISRARALLGYAPKVSVEEGVGRFVSWYKEFYAR